MVTSSSIIAAFPELSVVPGSVWTAVIPEAYGELNTDALGSNLDWAATLLAAHYASLATPGLLHGIVTEEHVGPVGRQFAQPAQGDADDYARTLYGMMFKRFVHKVVDYWCVG